MNKHVILVLVSASAVISVLGLGIGAIIYMADSKIEPSWNEVLFNGILY